MYIGECCDECEQSSGLGLAPIVAPLIGASATLISAILGHGKAPTMSAFGFHVDEYAAHILDAETQIVNLRNALAQAMHQAPPAYPMSPWPPNPANVPPDPAFKGSGCVYGGVSCAQWATAIRPIVAQYSAQADCVTNNNQVSPGGCYEQAYAAQQQIIQSLKQQLASIQTQVSGGASVPGAIFTQPGIPSVIPGMTYIPGQIPVAQPGIPPSMIAPNVSYPMPQISAPPVYVNAPSPSAPSSVIAAGMDYWPILAVGALGFAMLMMAPKEAPKKARR